MRTGDAVVLGCAAWRSQLAGWSLLPRLRSSVREGPQDTRPVPRSSQRNIVESPWLRWPRASLSVMRKQGCQETRLRPDFS
jgi:hypothetical protein